MNRLETIKTLLDEKKAENIDVIDLTSKDYIVDYVVIATTLNSKHGFALLNYLKEELKLRIKCNEMVYNYFNNCCSHCYLYW